jgi:hypothetical protein
MQQIADWLNKLGMSEYAPRFAENGFPNAVRKARRAAARRGRNLRIMFADEARFGRMNRPRRAGHRSERGPRSQPSSFANTSICMARSRLRMAAVPI